MSTPFPGSIATPFTPPFKVVRLYFIVARMTFTAVLLFVINVGLTLRKVKSINITIAHIIAAIIYLTIVASIGLLLGFNLSMPFIKGNHLHYMALHAAIGFGGWFSMIVMVVSSKLLPMLIMENH